MRSTSKFLFLLLILCKFSFAQNEANFWYFGNNAGLDFNGGAPVAVTNGQVFTSEGSASISDAAGNLLFYTDGIYVWDKAHVVMPNGSGLMGNPSSTQSAVIIQKPGSTTTYYIFAADAQVGSAGITYSEVDMTLNGGLGDITATKNVLLYTPSCEKLTGVRHCNNKDIWVLTHDWSSNAFKTFLITSAGVNTTPVISNAGLVVTGSSGATIGQLKSSPDGSRLASAIWDGGYNRFEVFDFDKSTGIVSHEILFPQYAASSGAYGVEFSPDGTKMYGAIITPGNVYQFDLCAGSDSAVAGSGVLVGTSANNFNGSLQIGPDKKVYMARYGAPWVGVINNPNTLGLACNYVDNGVSLAGKTGSLGLPNFVPYYFKPAPPPFAAVINCLNVSFTAPSVNSTNCSGSANTITSVAWNFGDPSSGANNASTANNPAHTFSVAGTFTVTLILNYTCGADTIRQNVITTNCGLSATTSSSNVLCNGLCNGTATANPTGGAPPYTYQWTTSPNQTTQTVAGLCSGNYSVTITDSLGTTVVQSVTIAQPSVLSNAISSSYGCNSLCSGSASIITTGGTPTYTYSWNSNPVQTTATATALCQGNYTCTITDQNGCTATQTITIAPPPVLSSTMSLTNNVTCYGLCNGSAGVTASGGTPVYSYSWNTNPIQTSVTAVNLCPGTYTCTITDSMGCNTKVFTSITEPAALAAITLATPGCSGSSKGTSTVSITGGTNPYAVSWSTIPVQTNIVAVNLSAGTYTVTITDNNNCVKIKTVVLTDPPPVDTLQITSTLCMNDPTIILNGPQSDSLKGPYQWYSGNGIIANANNTSYTGVPANVPGYSVTWYYNGCKYSSTKIQETIYPDISNLLQTNIFTPNGDNMNDNFFPFASNTPAGLASIQQLEVILSDYELVVYDRWGILMYQTDHGSDVWDGRDKNGNSASAGTYYWILKFKDRCNNASTQKTLKGFVQLIR